MITSVIEIVQELFTDRKVMQNRLFKIGFVALLMSLHPDGVGVHAAEEDVEQLETSDMSAQVRPGIEMTFRKIAGLIYTRSAESDEARAQLQALVDGGTLNYWETFEALLLVARTSRAAGALPEAQAALEKCLNFTDIDSSRRREALMAAGEFYVAQRDAEGALAVYEELNDMRGGRDSRTLMRIANVHAALRRDHAAAAIYAEAAIRYESGTPKRSQYTLLRTAYLETGRLEEALEIAKAMVDLFDYASDERSMDEIVARMNRAR